jgi:hypothetical protein
MAAAPPALPAASEIPLGRTRMITRLTMKMPKVMKSRSDPISSGSLAISADGSGRPAA